MESTPERSFSDLFSTSRGRAGDHGVDALAAQVRRGHHQPQRVIEGVGGIGEEVGDAAERPVLAGVKDVQDRADQERVAGLLPVITLLDRAFRVHEHVGDILDVAHLLHPAADLQQGIVGGGARVGRVDVEAMRKA